MSDPVRVLAASSLNGVDFSRAEPRSRHDCDTDHVKAKRLLTHVRAGKNHQSPFLTHKAWHSSLHLLWLTRLCQLLADLASAKLDRFTQHTLLLAWFDTGQCVCV